MNLAIQIAVIQHLAGHQARKDFLKRENGKRYRLKHRDEIAAWHRNNHKANREQINRRGREWYSKNKEKKHAKGKIWNQNNREKKLEAERIWQRKHPEKKAAYRKLRYALHKTELNKARAAASLRRYRSDPVFKMQMAMYRHLNKTIARQHMTAHCQEILGCTFEQLKNHLESQFKPGMNWKNYGLRGWHIDHQMPVSKFDLTNPDHIRRCFHFSNLQPMWWDENIRKSNKILPEFAASFPLANVAACN